MQIPKSRGGAYAGLSRNIRPPPPLPLSESLVSIPICVNYQRYRINPAAINAIIAVNVLYHEDADNKTNPVAMLAIPM